MFDPGRELILDWLIRVKCAEGGNHYFKFGQQKNTFVCVGCGQTIGIDMAMQIMVIERRYPELVCIDLARLEI